jgi:uncharacterized RmlC-like cupin family protein
MATLPAPPPSPPDFLFIPADIPHQPVNHAAEPALAIVARNDANEQESVELFSER